MNNPFSEKQLEEVYASMTQSLDLFLNNADFLAKMLTANSEHDKVEECLEMSERVTEVVNVLTNQRQGKLEGPVTFIDN